MTPEQQDFMRKEIQAAVRETVNGKIDGLKKDLQPLNDAFAQWNHVKASFVMYGTFILAVGGAIQAIQAIWSLVFSHVKP